MTDEQRLHAVCGSISGISQRLENITAIADSLARTFPILKKKQLLVDIGNLVIFDARTGIQRVTRSIAAQLLPPLLQDMRSGLYMRSSTRLAIYTHMITFCTPLALMTPWCWYSHRLVQWWHFYRPRSAAHIIPNQLPYLRRMHRDGVRSVFIVYDLYQFVFHNIVMITPFFPFPPGLKHQWIRRIDRYLTSRC